MSQTEKRFYVYGYSLNGKMLYIGKGTGSRKNDHWWQCRTSETYWSRALRKMLALGIKPECFVIQDQLSNSEALELERILISKYGRKCNNTGILYNLTEGGQGPCGRKATDSEKQAMRERMLGNSYALGVLHSEASKARIRDWQKKNKVVSEETKKKISSALDYQIELQIASAKKLIAHTWWGPHCSISFEGKIKRQSARQTHRLFTVELDGIKVDRTITDFHQGSCPLQFKPLEDKYK